MELGEYKLIGPFSSLLTMEGLSMRGAINNDQLIIRENVGVLVKDGIILAIENYEDLVKKHLHLDPTHFRLEEPLIGLPGLIDSHTHVCFGGSRHKDYSARNAGVSYLEIARQGGGIWDTVLKTRNATQQKLYSGTMSRVLKMAENGITTAEIKSGYGLSVDNEIKQLRIIKTLSETMPIDVVSTCLAAHIKPKDFDGDNTSYLDYLVDDLFPQISHEQLTKRIDIFVEEDAFTVEQSKDYIERAKRHGFQICIHGDQFSPGGSKLAVEVGALSVDHLEASTKKEIELLGESDTVATVLPGASLGLGCNFAPARALLDANAILAIASDWNPGSAPMGNLLTQAAILGASEKLTDAEVFAGLTFRAAKALNLNDRGILQEGKMADMVAFKADDFREILYHQGQLKAHSVWKEGNLL